MLPRIIRQQLASLRTRERLLRSVWAVARLLTVIIGLVILCCLIDLIIDRFQDTPFAMHVVLFILLLAGTIGAGVLFFWAVGTTIEDDELSLWVEDKTPALEHRLISAVQFNQEGADVHGMSRELVGVVTDEAVEHVRRVPVAQAADHSRLKLSAMIVGPALLLLTPLAVFHPELLGRLFFMDLEIPRRVKVVAANADRKHPRGEKVVVKIKTTGSRPDDHAYIVFNQNNVYDETKLTVSKETLFIRLDLLAAKAAELYQKVGKVRDPLDQQRQSYKVATAGLEELAKLIKKTEDPAKKAPLEEELAQKDKQAKDTLAGIEKLEGELNTGLYASQNKLREEIDTSRLEVLQFLKERPKNENLKAMADELELAVKLLDLDSRRSTLEKVQKRLASAQALLSSAPIQFVEGDLLVVELAVPDGYTWTSSKKDDVLEPGGAPTVRGHEQGPDTWTRRFTAHPGKATLELSCEKRDGGEEKSIALEVQVAKREVTYYEASVQASGDSLNFRAYIGDGRMKSESTLFFEPRPVAEIAAYTVLPSYCQVHSDGERDEIEQPKGEVSGIKGSTMRVQAGVLNRVKSAKLHLYETESRSKDEKDPWKTRQRLLKSIDMDLFLEGKSLKLVYFVPLVYDAKGELNVEGMEHKDIKEGAQVSCEITPSGGLMSLRLIDDQWSPIVGIDGPHRGTLASIDKDKRTLTLKREKGPTIAAASFDLTAKISHYSVEVTDVNDFVNNPIPKLGVVQFEEPEPIVKLLREEIPNDIRYQQLTGKKRSGKDLSDIFAGMPVPVGKQIAIAYKFSGPFGVGEAKLKYRILKKSLSGNANQISEPLGLALDDAEGTAKIRDVLAGSAADKAGLKVNDMITHVDSTKIVDVDSFLKAAGEYDTGQVVTIKFKREDQEMRVKVVMGARANLAWRSITLPPYTDDGSKGEFDLEKGCFKKSTAKESVGFYALLDTKPMPRMVGGGRYLFETARLDGGSPPQEGDQVEFYVEVYPAGDPTGRPFGHSETRIKMFASVAELAARILAAEAEYTLIRGIQDRQDEVFPDRTDPKKGEKKEKQKGE